jgi:hypothetical protein
LKDYEMIDLETCLNDWLLEAAAIDKWASPYAVTLTMNPASFYARVPLDALQASYNLRDFLKFLHNAFLGSEDMSPESRLRCIPILERGEPWRYHLCMEKPAHISEDVFMQQVFDCWWSTDFARCEADVKAADAGWIRHLAKLQSDPSVEDPLDWDNYWNPR